MKKCVSLTLAIALISRVTAIYHTTFCMPTARREVSYLDQVVQSYNAQNVFRMDGVALVVLDMDNSTTNAVKSTPMISLQERTNAICDTVDTEGLPSCQVRQQGLDVAAALIQCAKLTSGWVVLTEDDCEACSGALDEVVTTLSELNRDSTAMAKFSKFVRATAFPVDVVLKYAESVHSRLYEFPYDVTVMEQWASGRRQYVHARNLFHHVGHVSTEAKRNDAAYRVAYAELRGDLCFESIKH